ncbi:MAG: 4Fe-4S dicluster domain-containing protein [Promethearchaeota archaeon]|nr:MAG: 4Fe-4S dicluster domain-containing protein [Candidatus Lokiarchaeota archaeon]
MTELKKDNGCCDSGSVDGFLKALDLRIIINPSKCIGCGLCEEICPFGLPQRQDDGKYSINNPKECTECSACQRNCPTQAIIMQEQQGCGCLWDARKRTKGGSKDNSCCC